MSVGTSFPRHTDDAAGRFVLDLLSGLIERGHRVRQLAPEADSAAALEAFAPGVLVERFSFAVANWQRALCYGEGLGANIRRQPWLTAAVPALMCRMAEELEATLRRRPNALVMSHWLAPAGLVAARVARRLGRPHLGILHGGGLPAVQRLPGHSRLIRGYLSGTTRVVAVSQDLASKAQAAFDASRFEGEGPEIAVQGMGLRLHRFRASDAPGSDRYSDECRSARASYEIEEDEFAVVGVGRLLALKGFEDLIAAVSRLRGARVLIAGSGSDSSRRTLSEFAERRGVSLRLLGHRDPEELRQLYIASDVVAVPSRLGEKGRSEGSPVVIPEAFAAGACVVGTSTGGIPEVIEADRSGLVVPPSDPPALARALEELQFNSELREKLAGAGFQRAEEWDYTRVAAKFERQLVLAAASAKA